MGRMIAAYEKHGQRLLDASTPEAWAQSALTLLSERLHDGWYPDPAKDNRHPFVAESIRREARVLDMSEAEMEEFPREVEAALKRAKAAAQRRQTQDATDEKFLAKVRECVEEGDTGFVRLKRSGRTMPRAWYLLLKRRDHEYERVELVTVPDPEPAPDSSGDEGEDSAPTRVLVAEEKHSTRHLPASDQAQLEASALDLLDERLSEGHWYHNYDDGNPRHQWEDRAIAISEAEDGAAAWKFLQERANHEYEWVTLEPVG